MRLMTRRARLISTALLAGCASLSMRQDLALAQTLPEPMVPLAVLWEVNAGQGGRTDYMSSTNSSERNNYPFLGAIAYIRQNPSVYPVYRLSNAYDHFDSITQGVSGYNTDGVLGSPWPASNSLEGLAAINRINNPQTGDNATTSPNVTVLNGGTQYSGYQFVGTFGYGYQRYGNLAQSLQYDSGGGITEGSDFVAGGAIASWAWNGAQFVNSTDYGRYMQVDFSYTDPNSGITYNPIEAGDSISGIGQPGTWHGSPNILNQVSNGAHTTTAIPLEYGLHEVGVTGAQVTADTPYLYPTMRIGKILTLNFNNLGPVGQYKTSVTVPNKLTFMKMEIPSIYLNNPYGNFFYL